MGKIVSMLGARCRFAIVRPNPQADTVLGEEAIDLLLPNDIVMMTNLVPEEGNDRLLSAFDHHVPLPAEPGKMSWIMSRYNISTIETAVTEGSPCLTFTSMLIDPDLCGIKIVFMSGSVIKGAKSLYDIDPDLSEREFVIYVDYENMVLRGARVIDDRGDLMKDSGAYVISSVIADARPGGNRDE